MEDTTGRDWIDEDFGEKEGSNQVEQGVYGCGDGWEFIGEGGEFWWKYKTLGRLKRGLCLFKLNIFGDGGGDTGYEPMGIEGGSVWYIPFGNLSFPGKDDLVEEVDIFEAHGKCGQEMDLPIRVLCG